jgi:hypothetical protein
VHKIQRLGVSVEERQRDLARGEALSNPPNEEIYHRGPAEGAGQLLTEGGDLAQQCQ